MTGENGSAEVERRVSELLALYSDKTASAAHLLCDQHDPAALAFRVIDADLTAHDLTYGELRWESEQLAAAFAQIGIRAGDRVATLMGKSREYLVTLMAIWRLGGVHVPLFTAFAPAAIAFRLSGSNAVAVVCDAAQQGKLGPGPDMPASPAWRVITTGETRGSMLSFATLMNMDVANIEPAKLGGDAPMIHIYTSGTTGKPKGVVVPLRALAAFQVYAEFGQGLVADDMFWCAADPGWAYGLYFGVLSTFTTGTPSAFYAGAFSPEATMAILSKYEITNFAAAPTVYRSLANAGVQCELPLRLRCASSAGEPLTADVNEWAVRVLGVEVHDHYGQTEAGMVINNHHHPLARKPIKPSSMGQPMPGWSALILAEEQDEPVGPGVIGRVAFDVAKSPLLWFSGYADSPNKTAKKFSSHGRYYITGDTGSIDEDGYFHFSARDDDVIIMAGYRIGPFEVESAMVTHPAVAEAAVIAVPDAVRGEVMEAFVVPATGCVGTPQLENEIQLWVKTHYAAHAFPRRVHFVDALPKTPSGKIQRFVLKQRRRAELDEQSGSTA